MSGLSLGSVLDRAWLAEYLSGRGLKPGRVEALSELVVASGAALAGRGVADKERVWVFFVPGRIEVLGKHTDYAGGHSLVAATEQGFCLVAAARADNRIEMTATGLGQTEAFALEPDLQPIHGHWTNYPMTVARRLGRNFPSCRRGADIAFASDLPSAAGMSSSSAFIVGTYLVLGAINQVSEQPTYRRNIRDPLELAGYLGTNENGQNFKELSGDKGVGTFGGSEDHTAILCSEAGQLGQFAYCPTRFIRRIPLPAEYTFALGVSGVVAEKTGAAQEQYNRAALMVGALVETWCQATGSPHAYLAEILARGNAQALRRAVDRSPAGGFSTAQLQRRLDHFIAENEQVLGPAGDALAAGDLSTFGRLVDRSQHLTETLLGNQVPETVALAKSARQQGALAASAFGAGFGGSVWALVERSELTGFLAAWRAEYAAAFPQRQADFLATDAGAAAFELGGELC